MEFPRHAYPLQSGTAPIQARRLERIERVRIARESVIEDYFRMRYIERRKTGRLHGKALCSAVLTWRERVSIIMDLESELESGAIY